MDNGPGAALSGIGNVFGDPMQNALQQQKQVLTARELAGSKQLGSVFASSGAQNPALDAAAIANGMTPEQVYAAHASAFLNGGAGSAMGNNALMAQGKYPSSPQSQQAAEAAHMAETSQAANIAAQSQLRVAGLEPVQITNPDGSVGWTTKAAIATGHAPAGAQPLISPDMVKGALAGHNLLPQPGGGAVAPQQPDAAPAPQGAPFDPSSPNASIASLLGSAMPQPAAPAPSGIVSAPAANVGAPTADAMSDDQKQFLGLNPPAKALELKEIGTDAMNNPTHGIFDPSTGKVTPLEPQAGAGAPPTTLSDAMAAMPSGDAYLSTLAPQDRSLIKGMAHGDIQVPTATTRNGLVNPAVRAVMNYDPTFNAADVAARWKLKQEAASLKGNGFGSQVNAGQLALEHLGKMSDLVAGLQNGQFPDINAIKQSVGQHLGGQTPASVYDAEMPQLANEINRLYAGSDGADAAVQRIIGALNKSKSPDQLNGSMAGVLGQIQEKVGNLQNTWSHTMAPDEPPFPIIQPKHQNIIDTITARAAGQNPGLAAPPAVPGTLPPAAAPAQSMTLPGVTPPRPQGAFAPPPPKVGAVEDGHVYHGGDPHNPKNWSAVPGAE